MSLKTWLRDWLDITNLDEDTDAGLRRLENNMIELNGKLNTLDAHMRKIDELLKMPIDFRLAQAANSLKLLADFINEIQQDQISLEQKYAHKNL